MGKGIDADVAFLREAARYFRNRPTGGEDMAFWSNVYNAENCERIAKRLEEITLPANGSNGLGGKTASEEITPK